MSWLTVKPKEQCKFDLNYRPSLWKNFDGQKRAQEVNKKLARYVDVMIGNEEDFTASLGFSVPHARSDLTELNSENFKAMIGSVTEEFQNFKVIATTLRTVKSAGINDWGALAMTTPGDTSMASLAEVENLIKGSGARVQR